MNSFTRLAGCAVIVIGIGGLCGCGDDDPAAPQQEFSFEPVMSELWPNKDGNSWTFSAIEVEKELPGPGWYASLEELPPVPTFKEMYASLQSAQEDGEQRAGSVTLEFVGEHSGFPGVQIIEVTPTGGVEPPAPFWDNEALWKLEGDRVVGYSEFTESPLWTYLTSDLAPGDKFVVDPVGGFTDLRLEGRVWRHLQMPWDGGVINCVELVYLFDLGIQVSSGTNEPGSGPVYFRHYRYGAVVYGQGVGPMAWREKSLLPPSVVTQDLGNSEPATTIDVKMDLQSVQIFSPESMSIAVVPLPEDLDAPWTLSGPDTFAQSGNGHATLRDLAAGDYTLTWGVVEGWDRPTPPTETKSLTSGGSVEFAGTYLQQTGSITINAEPDGVWAPWVLSGPGGYKRSGDSDATLSDLAIGNYTLTWGTVFGWDSPVPSVETGTLVKDGTLNFSGTYIQQTGNIRIETEPDSMNVPWRLTGPGVDISGQGDRQLDDVPVGDYTLRWERVVFWSQPDPAVETQRLEEDLTLVFSGTYFDILPARFVHIPAGTFVMGSPESEPQHGDDEVQHTVTLSRGFYMARHEVTRQFWSEVMGSGTVRLQQPQNVETWDDAIEFCNALSLARGLTPAYTIHGPNGDVSWDRDADGYRLPTEAEWEYACRAGTTTAFANGDMTSYYCDPVDPNLDAMAWYCANSDYEIHKVGQKQPNAWGLYDMHGNGIEWCWDAYRSDYENLPALDPAMDGQAGDERLLRGGRYDLRAWHCRSAYRWHNTPDFSGRGFRVVRTAD